jgi:hypothetical protein
MASWTERNQNYFNTDFMDVLTNDCIILDTILKIQALKKRIELINTDLLNESQRFGIDLSLSYMNKSIYSLKLFEFHKFNS